MLGRIKAINWRLVFMTFVFVVTASFSNLVLFIAQTYAASVTQVSYTKTLSLNNCDVMQSSTTDGQYIYAACLRNNNNAVWLVKLDMSGNEQKREKFTRDQLGHANGMAYNSQLKRIVITRWDTESSGDRQHQVALIDPSNLGSIESIKTLDKGEIPHICYNAATDSYEANGRLYDSNFKYQKTIYDTGKINSFAQLSGATGQGIQCDESHIYVIRTLGDNNRIVAFDWSGNVTAVYELTGLKDELESLFISSGTLYAGINAKNNATDYFATIGGVLSSTATTPITVGTYNILGYYHGEGSGYASDRLKQIVKNINDMKYDVVGLQEYRDQASGDAKEFMKQLNSLNSSWVMSYTKEVGDSGQMNFVYNSSTLTLVSDRAIMATSSGGSCAGGTPSVRIATFTVNATQQEFMIANFHAVSEHGPSECDTIRLNTVKGTLADSKVASYTGPLFFVGDFNANPTGDRGNEKNVNEYLSSVGFGNARDIPGAVRDSGGGVIDHVYYKISSISAPSSYESLDCKGIKPSNPANYTSATTCASDHHPVKAVFGTAAGQGDCYDPNDEQFSAWNINLYDPTCVSTCSETTGTMSGDTNAKKIATYLASKGLSAIAIAGMLGNWDVEAPNESPFRQEGNRPWPSGGYGIVQWTATRRTNGTNTGVADILKKDSRTSSYFAEYYSAKYGDGTGESGIPDGVPTEVNDAWLGVELDFTLQEFNQKQYNIGGGYTKLLKTAVTYVNDGDSLKTALNAAKSATDAALIFTAIFEKQGALKPISDSMSSDSTEKSKQRFLEAVSERTEAAEKRLPEVQSLVGTSTGSTASSNCGTENASGVAIDGMMFPLQGAAKKYIGNGGGGKGSHLGGGTCPYYWAYDLMMNGSSEAKTAAQTIKVVAITDGTISSKVSIRSYSLGGQPYGWQLGLEASDGSLFYYTHMLQKPIVKVGQSVKVGDLLETGVKDVNGEHLHIDDSPKNKGRNGRFSTGISRSSCSGAQQGDFVELGPTLVTLWEAME